MHRLVPRSRRRRLPGLTLAASVAVLAALPGTAAAAGPALAAHATAAPGPAASGDAVAVTFSGAIKGIVVLTGLGGGDTRVSVTLTKAPTGKVRLVGSPDGCSTPLDAAERRFSLQFKPLTWVRKVVSGLMEEEGIWYYRSIRLVKPGVPPTQLACRDVRFFEAAAPSTAAFELENVLVSSYVVAGGPRGMIVAGPGTLDPDPVAAVIARRTPGVTYRLVASQAPCGTSHQAAETVFDRTFPSSGLILTGITALDDWETITSFRIFRGSGFSAQSGCFQNGIRAFVETV